MSQLAIATPKRGRPPSPITEGREVQTIKRRRSWLAYYYSQPAIDAWSKAATQNSKRRARDHGIEHELTSQDIANMFPVDGLCPILKVPLSIEQGRCGATPFSATVDRVDNLQGYTLENSHVISNLANRGKSALNMEQMIQMGRWAENHSA
jgi:hypothetical protein